jgi:hypothetical protein
MAADFTSVGEWEGNRGGRDEMEDEPSKIFMPFVAWVHQDARLNSGTVDYDKYPVGFRLKY